MNTSQSKRTGIGLGIAQALLTAAGTAGLPAVAGAQNDQSNATYVAHLSALNTTVTGLKTVGEATSAINGDSLTIAVNASGLPKHIEHWQHFPGFTAVAIPLAAGVVGCRFLRGHCGRIGR